MTQKCVKIVSKISCVFCCVVTVMGHVVLNMMELSGMSRSPRVDVDLRESLAHMDRIAQTFSQLTSREMLHVKAVQQFANG